MLAEEGFIAYAKKRSGSSISATLEEVQNGLDELLDLAPDMLQGRSIASSATGPGISIIGYSRGGLMALRLAELQATTTKPFVKIDKVIIQAAAPGEDLSDPGNTGQWIDGGASTFDDAVTMDEYLSDGSIGDTNNIGMVNAATSEFFLLAANNDQPLNNPHNNLVDLVTTAHNRLDSRGVTSTLKIYDDWMPPNSGHQLFESVEDGGQDLLNLPGYYWHDVIRHLYGQPITESTALIPKPATITVDAGGGADYTTIQAAIVSASAGDTIEVSAGTYTENINFNGKNISVIGAGPDLSIIDGGGSGSVVTCDGGETSMTVLDGFTITNGSATYGGGMNNDSSNPTVTNCTFSGNTADDDGGGMYNNDSSSPTVTNCTFSGNTANNDGGGMYNNDSSSPMVTNCTFSGNTANDDGGGMYNYASSSPTVTNCIFWTNSPDEIYNIGGAPAVNYSNIHGGWTGAGGTENINIDPLFVDDDGADNVVGTDDDNLHLLGSSPCIDAGDPNYPEDANKFDIDGDARVIGGRIDIGADEYTFGELSDFSDNGIVNFEDFAFLAYYWQGYVCEEPDWCEGCDYNQSGVVDVNDLMRFCENWLWQASWYEH
jgi:parallel beta-helix repeat protein